MFFSSAVRSLVFSFLSGARTDIADNAGKTTKHYLDGNISLENLNKTSYFQESEKENED